MSKRLPLSQRDPELFDLINAMCDGSITEHQQQRLNERLLTDDQAVHDYVAMFDLHAELRWKRRGGELPADLSMVEDDVPDRSELLREVIDQERLARIKREAEAALAKQQQADSDAERRESMRRLAGLSKPDADSQTRHYVIPKPLFYGSIAALIAVIAVIVWPNIGRDQRPSLGDGAPSLEGPTASAPLVATLVGSTEAEWSDGLPLPAGVELQARTYSLNKGFVELVFYDKAKVIIEAPATFALDSVKEITLLSGKLVGACEDERSKGFTVQTPGGRVVDYGTVFGVAVDDASKTVAQVFDGEIEITSTADALRPVRLNRDEAASVRPGEQVVRENPSVNTFIRDMPKTAYQAAVLRSRPMCYWSGPMDEDARRANNLGWLNVDGQTFGIEHASPGHHSGDKSGAFDFGTRERARMVLPPRKEFVFDVGFSIEAWCWIQPGHQKFMRIVSTRDQARGIGLGVNGLGRNAIGNDRVPNRPVLTFFGQSDILGADALPASRWVHLVVTVDESGDVSMFIDGKETEVIVLGPVGAKRPLLEVHPLTIGRNPDISSGIEAWNGRLDEIAIYNRVLTESEIREHYKLSNPE